MNFVTQQKIIDVVGKLAKEYHPKQIVLFGSFAYGQPSENSDLDLLIIKDTAAPPQERTLEAYRLLRGMQVPADLLVYTSEEFNKYKHIPHTIENEIFRKGKTVYMELSKPQIIQEWLKKGTEDLEVAKILVQQESGYDGIICFHCQQAVEKYLKAYLVSLEIEFPRTHHLLLLLDLIATKAQVDERYYNQAEKLQYYAVEVRSPLGRSNPNSIEPNEALEIASSFNDWILPILNG